MHPDCPLKDCHPEHCHWCLVQHGKDKDRERLEASYKAWEQKIGEPKLKRMTVLQKVWLFFGQW